MVLSCATPRCTLPGLKPSSWTSAHSLYSKTPLDGLSAQQWIDWLDKATGTNWTKPGIELAKQCAGMKPGCRARSKSFHSATADVNERRSEQKHMFRSSCSPSFYRSREAYVIYTPCVCFITSYWCRQHMMYCDKFHKNIPQHKLLSGSIFLIYTRMICWIKSYLICSGETFWYVLKG